MFPYLREVVSYGALLLGEVEAIGVELERLGEGEDVMRMNWRWSACTVCRTSRDLNG